MLNIFKLKENQTSISREIIAGITTFFAMAYIVIVAPGIMSHTGMEFHGLFIATCLVVAIGSTLCAFIANYPIAFAPGLGLLSYFSYAVVEQMGCPWQAALAAVFISGVIFFIITITHIREYILIAIPSSLGHAIVGGIGTFMGLIALKNVGLVISDSHTLVTLGNIHSLPIALFIFGFFLIVILSHRGMPGALIIGMLLTSVLSWVMGVAQFHGVFSWVHGLGNVAFQLDFHPMLKVQSIVIMFTFIMVALFDSTGSLIALTAHLPQQDKVTRMKGINRALISESLATMVSSLLGLTTASPFVENATGIKAGGRTGLTALVIAICFLFSIFLFPLAFSIPAFATSSALFYVGCLMMQPVSHIEWGDLTESVPAGIVLITIPLTFSIVNGIGFGILAYVLLKLCTGKYRELHWMLIILALIFVFYFSL